ncbi:MAG: hypothetical protein MJ105_01135 [Lachnospiraceae bacterium]|nr:hypothetical protein [Lachnospiraceae bacterium]
MENKVKKEHIFLNKMLVPRGLYFLMTLSATLLIGYLFTRVIYIGCDEAFEMYNYKNALEKYGIPLEMSYTSRGWHSFTTLLMNIVVPVFGPSMRGIRIYLILGCLICIFPCFYLVRDTKKTVLQQFLIGLMMVLFLLPTYSTNYYHIHSTAVILWVLLLVKQIKEKDSKILFLACILVLVFLAWFRQGDYLIIIMGLIMPIILYFVMRIWKEENYRRPLFLVIVIGCILYGVFRCLEYKGILKIGRIYGGNGYTSWSGIKSIFVTGIPMFFDLIDHMLDIPVNEGMVAIESVFTILKWIWLFSFLVLFIKKTIKYVQEPQETSFFEATIVLSIWCVFLICICNKTLHDSYATYGYTPFLGRYFAPLWFLTPVFYLCNIGDYITKFFDKEKGIKRLSMEGLSIIAVLSIIFSSCLFYPKSNRDAYYSVWEKMASYLVENGYKEGAVYEYTHIVDVDLWSDFAVHTACVGDNWGFANDDTMNEGYHYLNFVGLRTVLKDYYEIAERTNYYDYVDLLDLNNDLQGKIYFYDHDIRWKTIEIDSGKLNNNEFDWTVPLGTTRFEVYGDNLGEDIINFTGLDETYLTIESTPIEGGISYTIDAKDTSSIHVSIKEENDRLLVKTIYAAVPIEEGEIVLKPGEERRYSLQLNGGDYILTVCGENMMGVCLYTEDMNKAFEVQNQGTNRARFIINTENVNRPTTVVLKNTSDETITISSSTYELTIDEREMLMEMREEVDFATCFY